MLSYIRGFIALFILMTILVYLVPGENFKKYIRFFSEIILTFGFLFPVLSFICDSDQFLETIRYEEFTENLSELSRDADKIAYIHNDYYIEEYESAIEEDVKRIAGQYGFAATDVAVHMTEQYTVDHISLSIAEGTEEEKSVIEKIEVNVGAFSGEGTLADAGNNREESVYAKLKEELVTYYQLDEALIEIQYRSNG